MGTSLEFGFCPFPLDVTIGDVRVETLPGLDDVVGDIMSSAYVSDGWFHAPPRRRVGSFGVESVCPHPSRVFGLAKTHRVESPREDDEERSSFLVECLGFLSGMRFTTTEAGFLDCTPITRFAMGDFHCVGADLAWAAECCLAAYAELLATRCETTMRGAIHCLQMSLRRHLMDFERFFFLYTALEGCHFIRASKVGRRPRDTPHALRIRKLCEAFCIRVPAWSSDEVDLQDRFADLHIDKRRNELMHDGLFFGEPLGFAVYGGSQSGPSTRSGDLILLEMTAVTTRVLVSLLGMADADYVRSPYDKRSRFGLCRPRLDELRSE